MQVILILYLAYLPALLTFVIQRGFIITYRENKQVHRKRK